MFSRCSVYFETFYFNNKALFLSVYYINIICTFMFITYSIGTMGQSPSSVRLLTCFAWEKLPNVLLFNQWNHTFTTPVFIFVQSPHDFWGSGRMLHVDNTVRKVWNLITQSQVTPSGPVSFEKSKSVEWILTPQNKDTKSCVDARVKWIFESVEGEP